MKIIIVNRSQGQRGHVYCGRGSPLGNPFVMKDKSDEERNRVCDAYETWFKEQVENKNQPVLKQLEHIRALGRANGVVRIECYCAPKRCHCETIKKYIESENEAHCTTCGHELQECTCGLPVHNTGTCHICELPETLCICESHPNQQ